MYIVYVYIFNEYFVVNLICQCVCVFFLLSCSFFFLCHHFEHPLTLYYFWLVIRLTLFYSTFCKLYNHLIHFFIYMLYVLIPSLFSFLMRLCRGTSVEMYFVPVRCGMRFASVLIWDSERWTLHVKPSVSIELCLSRLPAIMGRA